MTITITVTLSGPPGSFPTPREPKTEEFSGSNLKEVLRKISEMGEHYVQRILSVTLRGTEQGDGFQEILKDLGLRPLAVK
jgi:hypothetical protein